MRAEGKDSVQINAGINASVPFLVPAAERCSLLVPLEQLL